MSGKVDIRGLTKFVKGIKAGSQIAGTGPIDNMLKAWGSRYMKFVRQRFVKFSRGGGDWKPLAASTKKARRGSKRRKTRSSRAKTKTTSRGSGKKFAILKDTATLLKALSQGNPGNLFKRVKGGIQVGFGGSAKYPKKKGKKGSTAKIADVAVAHNTGGKNLPQRQILAKPDAKTIAAMKAAAIKYVNRLGKKSSI